MDDIPAPVVAVAVVASVVVVVPAVVSVDFVEAHRNGSLGLVKRISTSRNRFGVNRTIEMYSKMDALAKLAGYVGVRFRGRSDEEAVEPGLSDRMT